MNKEKVETANITLNKNNQIGVQFNFSKRENIKFVAKKPPLYDLSKIYVPKHFTLNHEQFEKYQKIIKSPEGMKVLYNLKNRISKNFVNLMLAEVGAFTKEEDKPNTPKNIKALIEADANFGITFSNRQLGITRQDIWNEFIQQGLVKDETI